MKAGLETSGPETDGVDEAGASPSASASDLSPLAPHMYMSVTLSQAHLKIDSRT